MKIYKCCIKTTKKSQLSIYRNQYRKLASYAKNNPMRTKRDVISPEYVCIAMTYALYVVHHVVHSWVLLVVCLYRYPYGGETHGYSLRIPPQIFLWNIPLATP